MVGVTSIFAEFNTCLCFQVIINPLPNVGNSACIGFRLSSISEADCSHQDMLAILLLVGERAPAVSLIRQSSIQEMLALC